MSYTTTDILEMIRDYKKNHEILQRLAEDRMEDVDSTRISNYGIGASMPNGNRVSDRVFMAVNDMFKDDRVAHNLKSNIEYINSHAEYVEDYKLKVVFTLRVRGMTLKEIGKIMGVGTSRIGNMLHEIAEIMLEVDKEKV